MVSILFFVTVSSAALALALKLRLETNVSQSLLCPATSANKDTNIKHTNTKHTNTKHTKIKHANGKDTNVKSMNVKDIDLKDAIEDMIIKGTKLKDTKPTILEARAICQQALLFPRRDRPPQNMEVVMALADCFSSLLQDQITLSLTLTLLESQRGATLLSKSMFLQIMFFTLRRPHLTDSLSTSPSISPSTPLRLPPSTPLT